MRPVTLVLIVHDHQPVGNFDGVFEAAYRDAYDPFLAFLERHPAFRLALHTSGPLLQWMSSHQRGYLRRLRTLVDRGQIELWGGGFFEPVLPSIPEADRRGQILAMADWLELELGRRPRGLWLTERVWEPGLVASLAGAGVEYTAVDDAHFVAAGLERDRLWGAFTTEDQGQRLSVFPIHRELRYRVPFQPPAATVDWLRALAEGGGDRVAVLGDDGEKFGVWPGTHALCYEQGWLERFARALEEAPWIELRTPAEALERHGTAGLVYLPSAAYHEMEAWSLPPAMQRRHHRAAELLEPEFGESTGDVLRGGHWRNFLVRYPEANRLHKRMLRASRRLWKHPDQVSARWQEARTRLWRAQCNCPYWHGVFGGLYLPHLRSALYRELIAAEADLADPATSLELGDLDFDGRPDALLEGEGWAAWISERGGRLWAFDDRRGLWNYGDTLARRPEIYHDRLDTAVVGGGEGETIHGALRAREPGLSALVEHYDAHDRDSFLDRWEEPGRDENWSEAHFQLDGGESGVILRAPETGGPALEKRYAADAGGLAVHYTLVSPESRRGTLQVALNLALHVPDAHDRYLEIDGHRAEPSHAGARARHAAVRSCTLVDDWAGRRLAIGFDRPADVSRAPIETVSLSEQGAERVMQGVELRVRVAVELEAGTPWRMAFRLEPAYRGAGA